MGFEPMTLRDLVGCFNPWATGDSMASKGEMWVVDIIYPGFISCVYDLKSRLHDLNLTFTFDISQIMMI